MKHAIGCCYELLYMYMYLLSSNPTSRNQLSIVDTNTCTTSVLFNCRYFFQSLEFYIKHDEDFFTMLPHLRGCYDSHLKHSNSRAYAQVSKEGTLAATIAEVDVYKLLSASL